MVVSVWYWVAGMAGFWSMDMFGRQRWACCARCLGCASLIYLICSSGFLYHARMSNYLCFYRFCTASLDLGWDSQKLSLYLGRHFLGRRSCCMKSQCWRSRPATLWFGLLSFEFCSPCRRFASARTALLQWLSDAQACGCWRCWRGRRPAVCNLLGSRVSRSWCFAAAAHFWLVHHAVTGCCPLFRKELARTAPVHLRQRPGWRHYSSAPLCLMIRNFHPRSAFLGWCVARTGRSCPRQKNYNNWYFHQCLVLFFSRTIMNL